MPRGPIDFRDPFDKGGPLFGEHPLDDVLQAKLGQVQEAIDKLDPNYLLNVSESDLLSHLEANNCVDPVLLRRDHMTVDGPHEAEIDVSHNILYAVQGTVRGMAFTVVVPFEGEEFLLRCRPQQWDSNPPAGRLADHEIHLDFQVLQHDPDAAKRSYEDTLNRIQKYLAWGTPQVQAYNKHLPQLIRQAVTNRKQKLLADRNMVAALGLPLRRRDLSQTYAVPTLRRRPQIELPRASVAPFKPEPILATEDYNFILKILQDMTLVIERSPHAFDKIEEEHLRFHFLVQLNGHFEGAATGETFNADGKTDILIRHENRNVFIAECKFWRGDKVFLETVDQLLGYTSWRDTKTAILVFNRNKDTTKVLEKIPELVKAHPSFKRELPRPAETQFQYILGHRDDANRELILTVMVFDVPRSPAKTIVGA